MLTDRSTKTRDKILQAAFSVLSRDGYENASIKDIAAEAGVAQGLVHYYFKSKQQLVLAVLFEVCKKMDVYTAEGEQGAMAAFENFKTLLRTRPDAHTLYIQLIGVGLHDEEIGAGIRENIRSERGKVEELARQVLAERETDPRPARAIAGAVWAGILESARAANLITSEFATSKVTSNFILLFTSKTESVGDPAFKAAVTAALAPIEGDSRISSLITPYNAPSPRIAQAFTSTDGHQALVSIDLKSSGMQARKDYDALRAQVHSGTLTVTGTGFVAINEAFNKTLEADLQRAETVTLPVTLILLVIIFASLVAAGLPLGVGVLTILGGLAGTFFLNRITDVSQYALNIVTLIGLGVSIDYSLFVVNRFRDELARGASREDAVATTMATAGRAITFSGITVAVGLSAMLFFQGTFMASMGAAGAIVVAVALVYTLTFLPTILSLLRPRG